MPHLRYEVRLELAEKRYTPVGHPCGQRVEPLIIVCTSLERVSQTIVEKSKEGDICALSIRTIDPGSALTR